LEDCSAFIVTVKQLKKSIEENLLTLKMKVVCFFEISATIHPTTQHYTPEDFNLQQHDNENLKYHADFISGKPNNNLLYYST
jgi:hypothetical protein